TPFASKGGVMRFCYRIFTLAVLAISAFASDLTVRVVDPQSAAVAGARVELFRKPSQRPLAVDTTSAQGVAHFSQIPGTEFGVHVLAPGFKEQWQDASSDSRELGPLTVALEMAVTNETVVVSATRTPAPGDQSGASVAMLSGAQPDTMLPVAAGDAMRFLPGAVVSTSGQRGGLGSLFVRGGESRYNKVIVDGVPVNDPGGTFDFGTLPLDQADRLEFLRG